MNERLDSSFLDDAMRRASQEARHAVADALACHLHNDGYALEGNTEANDIDWFARRVWEVQYNPHRDRWETISDETRDSFRRTARAVLDVLPQYQLRVAHRLITLSNVVRDIERAERKQRAGGRPNGNE